MVHISNYNSNSSLVLQLRHNREIAYFQLLSGFLLVLLANFIFGRAETQFVDRLTGIMGTTFAFVLYFFVQGKMMQDIEAGNIGHDESAFDWLKKKLRALKE